MGNALKGFIKASVFLLILITVLYVVSYNIWENNGFEDDGNYLKYFDEEEYNQSISNENIDLEIAKKIHSSLTYKNISENFGKDYFSLYYGKDYLTVNKLPSNFIIYLAIINLNNNSFLNECNNSITIPTETVDKKIKELFGNIKYDKISWKSKDESLEIIYNEEFDNYTIINKKCSGISFGEGHIETEFIESRISGNTLEIYEYVYYLDYVENSDGSYVLNYYDSLDNNGKIVATGELDNVARNKLLKYKFTFKIENDNYYFETYEKVK